MFRDPAYIRYLQNKYSPWDLLRPADKRTSNGRKRTTTAAAQKRAKIKRRNKK